MLKFFFKANANELAIELKEDWSDEICFKEFTSLRDSETTGTNGDVLFTTVGAAGNDTYTIIISFKKVLRIIIMAFKTQEQIKKEIKEKAAEKRAKRKEAIEKRDARNKKKRRF